MQDSEESLITGIDELLALVHNRTAIPQSEMRDRFSALDERIYILAFELGVHDALPQQNELARECNFPGLPAVRFEGHTNLAGDWTGAGGKPLNAFTPSADRVFVLAPLDRWQRSIAALRELVQRSIATKRPKPAPIPDQDPLSILRDQAIREAKSRESRLQREDLLRRVDEECTAVRYYGERTGGASTNRGWAEQIAKFLAAVRAAGWGDRFEALGPNDEPAWSFALDVYRRCDAGDINGATQRLDEAEAIGRSWARAGITDALNRLIPDAICYGRTRGEERFEPATNDETAAFPPPTVGRWGYVINGSDRSLALAWVNADGKPVTASGDGFVVMGGRFVRPHATWLPERWTINVFPAGWSLPHLEAWFNYSLKVAADRQPRTEVDAPYYPEGRALVRHAHLIVRHLNLTTPHPEPRGEVTFEGCLAELEDVRALLRRELNPSSAKATALPAWENILREFLWKPAAAPILTKAFKGQGHDDLLRRLRGKIDQTLTGCPKAIILQCLRDDGCDLSIDWGNAQKYGIQLKSHFDIGEKDFEKNTLAQIQRSKTHGLRRLYILLAGDLSDVSQEQKVRGFEATVSKQNDEYVITVSPERLLTLLGL